MTVTTPLTGRRFRFSPLLAAIFLAVYAVPASGKDASRILVYLEVPEAVAAVTDLELASLVLVGPESTIPLEPLLTDWRSADLAGTQLLLASREVPAGLYEGLHLDWKQVRTQVGVAPVTPELPEDGQRVSADLALAPGQALVLALMWNPRPVTEDDMVFEAALAIRIPEAPPGGAAAFVTSRALESVLVVDRNRNKVVGAIPVDGDPRGLAYAPGDQALYVALAERDAIAEVDALSYRLRKTVPLVFGDDPDRLLLSVDGTTLYVLNTGSRTLVGLTAWSLQEQFRVPVGEGPRSLAQDSDTRQLYVACEDEGRVLILDPTHGGRVAALGFGSSPSEVVVDPRSRRAYVGGGSQRRIYIFDPSTEESSDGPSVCGAVNSLAYNPGTGRLFIGVPECRLLAVVSPETGLEFASIDLPGAPGLMDFDREFRKLFVVLPGEGALAVCRADQGRIEAVIDLGDDPYAVVVP